MRPQETKPIELERGETRTETFSVYNDDGNPQAIDGCDLWFTVRRCPGGEAVVQKSLVGGVSNGITMLDQVASPGKFQVLIDHDDTLDNVLPYGCSWEWDVWIRDTSQAYQPLCRPTPLVLIEGATRWTT